MPRCALWNKDRLVRMRIESPLWLLEFARDCRSWSNQCQGRFIPSPGFGSSELGGIDESHGSRRSTRLIIWPRANRVRINVLGGTSAALVKASGLPSRVVML